jgi:hypothetical protein
MSQHPGHEEWGWYTEKIRPQHMEDTAMRTVQTFLVEPLDNLPHGMRWGQGAEARNDPLLCP